MNNPRRGRGRSGRRPNIPTRSQNFDSNGPEGRVRGNAQQVYEKYLALARDAQVSGDRVLAEAFQQHAEHYYRVMSDSTDPDQRPREHQQGQSQQGQYQRDDGDEGERYQEDRGHDRRDERYEGEAQQERRGDDGRNERRGERRPQERHHEERHHEEGHPGEPRSDREQRANGESRPNGEAADASGLGREAEAREGRLRDRLNRRNGEGILTRRRGGELDKAGDREGGVEEEADAGLRKMLGEDSRPQGVAPAEPGAPPPAAETAPEAPVAEAVGEAAEAAPAKPRRRRRTKAEMEKDSTEQTAE